MMQLKNIISDKIKHTILYVILDAIFINVSLLISAGLWYDGTIPGGMKSNISLQIWEWFLFMMIIAPLVRVIVFAMFKFYSRLWKYTGSEEIIKVIIADTIVFVLLYFIDTFFLSRLNLMILPKRLLFASWSIDLMLFIFSRFGFRLVKRMFIYIGHIITQKTGRKRVMIIGAGFSGYTVVRNITNRVKGYEDRLPIIIVDDDLNKNNTNINGVRVICGTDDIPELAEEYEIEEIIIAIPSASNVRMKKVLELCNQTDCTLKMIPPMSDVSDGMKNNLRDVKISDLLFRDEVNIDIKSISGYLHNKNVLVTGGGGSIGSELCRQIAVFNPAKLIIFDIYENNAYELMNELKFKYGDKLDIVIRIGSVRDYKRLQRVFMEFSPAVVFHAAAHKHVILMQENPCEAVKNNVFGTINAAKCADEFGVDRFVLLSTDKAVNPTNVMGATKRITELIIQHMSSKSKTKFMAVRFGNVLGSNGSVIPIFQSQIEQGGPVTVTHPDVVRYFMTIPEASKLVLQAAGMGQSGRIFVLDMGEPVKINDLARNLIKLSGYVPDKDIKIVYTGLRSGEKLYEELILGEEHEKMKVTYHNKIFVTKPTVIDNNRFNSLIEKLRRAAESNSSEKTLELLHQLVPNFKESSS